MEERLATFSDDCPALAKRRVRSSLGFVRTFLVVGVYTRDGQSFAKIKHPYRNGGVIESLHFDYVKFLQ